MSNRNRHSDSVEENHSVVQAGVQAERHRVHDELVQVRKDVQAGVDPDEVDVPDEQFKRRHHRNPDVAKRKASEPRWRRQRHWKTKDWKRRKLRRAERARRLRELDPD